MSAVPSCCQPQTPPSCCQPPQPIQKPTILEQYVEIATQVSVVALGAFAAYTSIELFLPFFFVGAIIGVAQSWTQNPDAWPKQSSTFCTQGFFEMATGIKLPPILNLLTNVALTAAHINHLIVYPPIIGIYVGGQAGRLATPFLRTLYYEHIEPAANLCSKKFSALSQSFNHLFKHNVQITSW